MHERRNMGLEMAMVVVIVDDEFTSFDVIGHDVGGVSVDDEFTSFDLVGHGVRGVSGA